MFSCTFPQRFCLWLQVCPCSVWRLWHTWWAQVGFGHWLSWLLLSLQSQVLLHLCHWWVDGTGFTLFGYLSVKAWKGKLLLKSLSHWEAEENKITETALIRVVRKVLTAAKNVFLGAVGSEATMLPATEVKFRNKILKKLWISLRANII